MDPLPPDPYLALGVPRDATLAAIKTAYRKAALKCHPDKVPGKGDEFHKINTAYQLIGEEDDRQKYEAEVRLHALKKEQQNRFGGGRTRGSSNSKTAAFDVRGSPRPGFEFHARTVPKYDTAERRPSGAFASARPSPYTRDEGDDYFGPKASAKRYDSYDEAPRRNSGAKIPHREEIRKAEVKKEKASSKQTTREENKKQRDKDVRYNRRAKAASVASLDSDDSDFDPRPARKENVRKDAFVKKRDSKKSDDDYYERTKRPENHRTSVARDYIGRSRTDGPPDERGPPPPAYANGPRRDTGSPSPSPRRREEHPTKIRGSSERPEMVRRSSAKPKERSSAAETPRARPGMPRRVSTSRRSPSPDAYARPSLQKMVSEPQSIRIPPPDTDSRRDRSYTQEPYKAEARDPPTMRRSQTDVPATKSSPLKQSRREDATPVQSSRLRNVEIPANNDSGYSTSSPSEDSPRQTQKTSRHDLYDTDETKPSHYFREDADRDQQRRPTLDKERSRGGPPPSRSASYAYEAARNSDEAPRRASPQTSRRPSLQHSESERRPPSTQDIPLRRQTLERETSGRGSSRTVPTLSKNPTMPPLKTGRLFGEMDSPFTRSPKNLSGSDSEDYDRPRRCSPLDRERGSPADRNDVRNYRQYIGHNLDSGYGSYGPAHSQPRRASEDIGKVRAEATSRANAASRYIEETMRPVRRQGTYAGQ